MSWGSYLNKKKTKGSHRRGSQDELTRAGILSSCSPSPGHFPIGGFPHSLPLSSALLSHPETDHLRQWDESRRRSETKRELLDNRCPASALVPLMGVGGNPAADWSPALPVSQMAWCVH
ncbi:hypothetical protein EYF80_013097 [Liparis tanakae]|uniref:Uncharacterized protein n=1 Tax=Liparis tanakae TaxID=230148 RepID=A0A4Z2IG64_9TELE|nr:hypothetical protein EYF80_013097 [Liparis tanakae]